MPCGDLVHPIGLALKDADSREVDAQQRERTSYAADIVNLFPSAVSAAPGYFVWLVVDAAVAVVVVKETFSFMQRILLLVIIMLFVVVLLLTSVGTVVQLVLGLFHICVPPSSRRVQPPHLPPPRSTLM